MRRLLVLGLLLSTGCISSVRETTTARTATEMLLVSTAAERAVQEYDASHLDGKRVFIDEARFESVDKNYVISALRDHLAGQGLILVAKAEGDPPAEGETEGKPGADVVVEVRNASLGIYDSDFVLGIPQLPVSAQGFPPVLLPPLYAIRRLSQEGWAKFQLWTYDPSTMVYLDRSQDLWGTCYYNQWWVFGIGPFTGSNDVYPDWDLLEDEEDEGEE